MRRLSADPVAPPQSPSRRPSAGGHRCCGGWCGGNQCRSRGLGPVLEFLHTFELSKVWLRLETGGVVVVLAMLPLMPVVMVILVVLFSLVLGAVAWTVRGTRQFLDQRVRVPCSHCGHAVRPEASVCSSCGGALEPVKLLDQPGMLSRGWDAAFDYVRDRRQPLVGSGA